MLSFSAWAAMSVLAGPGDVMPSDRGQHLGRTGVSWRWVPSVSPTAGCLVANHYHSCLPPFTGVTVLCHPQNPLSCAGFSLNPESPEKKIRKCSHSRSLTGDVLFYGSLRSSVLAHLARSTASRVAGRPCWGESGHR